jgi:hypothetical protein
MNHLSIPDKKIEVDYPSFYDEISQDKAARIGEIMYLSFRGEIDIDMARKLAVDCLLNRVNGKRKPMTGDEANLYWGIESLLADSVNWLFRIDKNKDGTEAMSINPKFCKQLIPAVRIRWRLYRGPKDLLSDFTIYQFKEASWRVGKYGETKDDQYLNEIFAVLYHTKKNNSEAKFQQRLKDAARVPAGVKFMAYLFIIGCLNWLKDEPVEIDGQEINFGCLFGKGVEKDGLKDKGGDTGMAGILFQMAESGVFGNLEQTSKVAMWDVFLRLYQIHYQIKSMKI